MATSKEKVFGKVIVNNIPSNLCWETPQKFVQQLPDILGVELSTGKNNNFVIIGHEPPSEDDKDKLWVRLSTSGIFLGFYIFENGSWTKVQNRRADEVVWFVGDSRSVPDGFQLIVPGVGGIPSAVVDHIVSMYEVDTAASSLTVGTVYRYFACRYIGTTT